MTGLSRTLLVCGVGYAALAMGAPAAAEVRTFNIPAQDVAKAIPEFARQAGVQITAPVSQLRGVRTPAVTGRKEVREALAALLRGTGLTVARDTGALIVLRPTAAGGHQVASNQPTMKTAFAARDGGLPFAAAQATAALEPAEIEEVVVTGSRIVRAGFEAPTPVTAVQTEDLARKAPGAVADGLNQLPQFQNSIRAAGRSTGQANTQNTGNYLNMRALGTNRVLVLQDGQRMANTGNNGGVDVSLIPSMLVERVEVVTGGASAVYGSDAVSGVVNFILNKRLTGLRALVQGGVATRGVLPSYKVGVAGGASLLDDRLHIIASAERYHTDPLRKRDVPEIGEAWSRRGLGTVASPYSIIRDVRSTGLNDHGVIISGAFSGARRFDANGNLVVFDPGVPTGLAGVSIGGDGGLQSQALGTTTASQTMNQYFIRPEMEFGGNLVGFVSVSYNTSGYESYSGGNNRRQSRIFNDNAFLTPSARTAFGTATFIDIGRIYNEGPDKRLFQASDSLVVNAGFSGRIADNYKWDIGVSHSVTDFLAQQDDTENARYYAATDAVRDPATGNIVCRVLLDPSQAIRDRYRGCIPLNIMGAGNPTVLPGFSYAQTTSQWTTKNKMDAVQATVAGDLFDLPAGPLSFAAGAEYREVSLVQESNANPAIAPDFTGLRNTLPAFAAKYALLNTGVADGSLNVKEAYAELSAPVFRDTAIGSLELNGAGRLTDYSTSGRVTTWKIGGLFDPMEGVRIRATLSRDIRAPTLFELFAGRQFAQSAFSDPLTNTNIAIPVVTGGNPELQPEDAKTFTAGVVLRPTAVPGLSVSMDYYSIDITGAIASPFTAAQVFSLCTQSNYTSPICNQIARPFGPSTPSQGGVPNTPTSLSLFQQNLASQLTRGVDFEAAYGFDLGGGRANARVLGARLIRFDQANAVGQPVNRRAGTADFAGAALPKWRGLLDFSYTNGPLRAGFQERYIGSYRRSAIDVYAENFNDVKAIFYTDINVSYTLPVMTGEVELFAVVNNLFGQKPPLTPATQTAPGLSPPFDASTYDLVGRYVTIGARLRW